MNARIVVIGAGIGGLAAAAGLGREGARWLSSAPRSCRTAGVGIQIAPNGAAVLHRLGLAGVWPPLPARPPGSCAAGRTTR